MRKHTERPGFSLVEIIIAMLILSVGVLAMGASTGYVMNQIQASELRSERMAATRQAAEILGGTDWNLLPNRCSSADSAFSTNRYTVSCHVTTNGNLAEIRLITVGPGFRGGTFDRSMADTFKVSIAQPVQ